MITAFVNTRGFLEFRADQDARDELTALDSYQDRESLVLEALRESWELIAPEQVAALTSSPIFCDSDGLDNSDDHGPPKVRPDAKLFWFPNYQICDPWEHLAEHGAVEFDPAPLDS